MANTHESFGQHMKQEAVDKFLDFEILGLEPVPFSIAISEGDLPPPLNPQSYNIFPAPSCSASYKDFP